MLTAPFTNAAPALFTAARMTPSVAATELMMIWFGRKFRALAVPIARTVGVGVVRSTHVSAPEARWRAI